jgi:hypothetical protein
VRIAPTGPFHFVCGVWRWGVAVALLLPGTALAGPLAPGDGSWVADAGLFSPVAMADAANWTPVAPDEPDFPYYDLDWSLGTRGSFIRDSSGQRFEAALLSSASLNHTGKLFSYGGTASAEASKTDGGGLNIDELRLSGTSTYQVDPRVKWVSNASIAMTREDVDAPDVPSDVAETPLEISGTADTAYTRKFGRLNATVRGTAGRDVYGPTTLTDGSLTDNRDQNNTRLGTGLRLGYQLTPVLEVFADAGVQRTVFDAPSTSLGASLDSNQYTLLAGIAVKRDETLSASVSAGVGLARFDDPTLPEVRATLYDASLTYRPTEALSLNGAFTTTIGAPGPDGQGTARVAYEADAGATYLVNDWLDWRAAAGWHRTEYAGSDVVDTGYSAGLGADYAVGPHVKLSADYSFERGQITPSPVSDTHTVSLGLTVSK